MSTQKTILSILWSLCLLLTQPAAAETGVSDSSIIIGQSAPLSGPNKELGIEMKLGAQLYFDHINSQGGVNGRRIEMRSLDDGYEQERTAANTRQLIEKDGVFALFGYVGTATSQSALQISNPAKVPFVGAFSGADSLRAPLNRLVFNIRAGYGDETEKIVEQFTSLNVKNIAVFYQNDAFGKTGLEGVEKAMKKRGLKLVATGSVERNSSQVADAVRNIAAARPDVVVMISTYNACAAFVKGMRAAGTAPQFYTLSVVGSSALARELGTDSMGIGISQVVPFPWTPTLPVVREYQKLLAKAGNERDISFTSLEGYIAAKVLVEGLKRAGRDLTREKLIAALEGLRNHDVGGFPVSFGPGNHNGSSFVELTMIRQGGKFVN